MGMMNMNQLFPDLLSIGELFADPDVAYIVPIYQRNYAWRSEQIEQLLGDIRDAIRDDKASYFLGNLMVTQKPSAYFEVIDGQQRLTTLYLLLTFLAERGVVNNSHQNRLRYESRPRATEALRRVSLELSSHSGSSAHSSTSEDTGIHQGYNVIRQYMDQHVIGEDEQKKFAEYLLENVSVVRASLPRKTDFNRYFEIMNTRGQQLKQTDIVKARLMQHLDDDEQRACFAWIWEACSDMDSYVQMSLTRDAPKLRTAIFGDDWSRLVLKKFDDLVKIRGETDASMTVGPLPCQPLTIDEALVKYAEMGAPETGEDQDNVRFRSTIEFPAFLLHVLKVMDRGNQEDEGLLDDKGLIRRFAEFFDSANDETSGRVQLFAYELLRCRNLFDSYVLKRQYTVTNSDEGDWSLQRLIKRVSNNRPTPGYINTFSRGSNDVEEDGDVDPITNDLLLLESMLRVTYTSPRTMHWITLLLKRLGNINPDDVKESDLANALRNYARSKVKEAYPLGNAGEGVSMKEPEGFSINRIVFTYLDYLLWTEQKSRDYRFSFRNSIEHFYPQHPDEQQVGEAVSVQCLHMLGNLALVSVGANSKFSNSLPRAKAENFRTTIEIQSPKLQKMAEITRSKGKWGDEEIRAHHDAMFKYLRNDLGCNNGLKSTEEFNL